MKRFISIIVAVVVAFSVSAQELNVGTINIRNGRSLKPGQERPKKGDYSKFNGWDDKFAPNSYDLCTKVLRNEWGFDGVVMTDWFSTGGNKADTALCMKAGNDLLMPGGGSYKAEILKGLKKGIISEEDLRRCCANVVRSIMNSATQKEYIK